MQGVHMFAYANIHMLSFGAHFNEVLWLLFYCHVWEEMHAKQVLSHWTISLALRKMCLKIIWLFRLVKPKCNSGYAGSLKKSMSL
jgi:hypothetical protein